MVLAVARQATDVVSVVFSASPRKSMTILRVALKTRAVYLFRRHLSRTRNVLFFPALNVLFTICVASLARSCTITIHELGAFAVCVRAKSFDDLAVTRLAVLSDLGLLNQLFGGL
jgi:hypothetical protein